MGKAGTFHYSGLFSREVVNDIIEQEIGYYKVYLNSTKANIYVNHKINHT
jgi:hypothetical protein